MDVGILNRKIVEDKKGDQLLLDLSNDFKIRIYRDSLNESDGCTFLIGREGFVKSLYLISVGEVSPLFRKFEGEIVESSGSGDKLRIMRCGMTHSNALRLQELFPFTRATAVGLTNSFGFGDRLGLANAGHLRALKGYRFKPILAQQSIRELTRTNRTPEDVMDAAVWAVFQEGYKDGFGADADHLKRTDDIDRLIKAGFRTFTFDPSDFVVNGVEELSLDEVKRKVALLPWKDLQDNVQALLSRYEKKTFKISDGFSIAPAGEEVFRAALKYCAALVHIRNLYSHLKKNYSDIKYEVEVSIDETDTITSPFEHFFIVTELKRLGVIFVSLAPRFIGDFEKGIDYKGDLGLFRREYEKHANISVHFGDYKISLHSGSDKLSAYKEIGKLNVGLIHIKTAGTSYLEALKVVANKNYSLFREILDFSVGLYADEKKSYHVSADVKKLKRGKEYRDDELAGLFNSNDVRQILHVTYGRVLTEKNKEGNFLFRDRIYKCLIENEELHYRILFDHFRKHLEPFRNLA